MARSLARRTESLRRQRRGESRVLISARCQHAEFVAFRVGHHDPGDLALSDVDPPCPECDETLDLRSLVAVGRRCDIEVKSVLPRFDRAGRWTKRHEGTSSV